MADEFQVDFLWLDAAVDKDEHTDKVLSVFDIEKHLEMNKFSPMPHIITTERPDKVSRSLAEGRVALSLNGSSQVIILPANITDLLSSPEDAYLRVPYSIFIKLVRIIAVFLSLQCNQ